MDSADDILARARERAETLKLPYAGALLPVEAHALMQQVPGAKLVDVRTQAEWEYVGHIPDSILIEWNSYPEGQRNPRFLEQLQKQVPTTEEPVLFLRSEEHTSELQSLTNLVCRLLLEK